MNLQAWEQERAKYERMIEKWQFSIRDYETKIKTANAAIESIREEIKKREEPYGELNQRSNGERSS